MKQTMEVEFQQTLKTCPKCGGKFAAKYNRELCPDCSEPMQIERRDSLGNEDMVSHFHQNIGTRLQRFAWGHFS